MSYSDLVCHGSPEGDPYENIQLVGAVFTPPVRNLAIMDEGRSITLAPREVLTVYANELSALPRIHPANLVRLLHILVVRHRGRNH